VNISTSHRSGRLQLWAGGMLLLACGASTGCQIDVAGQTLPSPYHLSDDVQYYAPGPEFKLANEAAALQEQRAQEISEPQAEGLMAPGPMRPGTIPAVPPAPVGPEGPVAPLP
jgi:hypothetical protein